MVGRMFILALHIWLIMITNSRGSAVSYNQPEFCSNAAWESDAITFANSSTIGSQPYAIFVNTNDTVYMTDQQHGQILIWLNDSNNLTATRFDGFNSTLSLFVTINNDIYVNGGYGNKNINKWIWNSSTSTVVMNVPEACYGLFVDIDDYLYCSMFASHQVIKSSLNSSMNMTEIIIAGTGCAGVTSDRLYNPQGIFIHTNFSLYVADCGNDRIQLFQQGELNGTTIAGNGAPDTIVLNCPSDIVLDGHGYLFIVDQGNQRIVGSGLNGFRCLVGCTGSSGSAFNQLQNPQSMAFDSNGNIFVTDRDNSRIQKFILATTSCDETVASTTDIMKSWTDATEPVESSYTTASMISSNALNSSKTVSYNRPKLKPMAAWRADAITFADSTTIGYYPLTIFINTENTIYAAALINNRIQMWLEGNSTPTTVVSSNLQNPYSIFVVGNGDIYIGNDLSKGRVDRWMFNPTTTIPEISISQQCFSIFVDINDTLYCSISNLHQIIAKPLDSGSNLPKVVAGTGCVGYTSYQLNDPHGIFVDINFNLYVADFGNSRIQLFKLGQFSAITVAGSQAPGTIILSYPIAVVLDADNYLFIVDYGNHRIVGSGPTGFRCVVGCFGQGSAPNQLNYPWSMSFDSYGNIFVTDTYNHRIQKFVQITNACDVTITSTTSAESSTGATRQSELSSLIISTTAASVSQPPKVVSYNQPKFNSPATWSANGLTFATSGTIGLYPYSIFVNTNNTVYVADRQNGRIQVWSEGNTTLPCTIFGNLSNPHSLFVTITNDIFVDNGYDNSRVDKWTLNATINVPAMVVNQECYGLFVDINATLYCSIMDLHHVVATSLNSGSQTSTIVAGTSCPGETSYMLYYPCGIFVDVNFDLYVADSYNDRIQRFQSGQLSGTTIGADGVLGAFTLQCPTGVVLDADNYLFIVDSGNHRILGSGPNGFRCLVGCFISQGSDQGHLSYPQSMAFDRYGNLLVTDMENSRIQKFLLLNNSLVPSYNHPEFCPTVNWIPNAITLENNASAFQPYGIYINTNNTAYVTDSSSNQILLWANQSINLLNTISGVNSSFSIFVTITGDIYVGDSNGNNVVQKWKWNTTTNSLAMSSSGACYGLFVDVSNTLYCSIASLHQVVKKWLGDGFTTSVMIAGTNGPGSSSNALSSPRGIFVDINFNLYVADCGNNRIQLFKLGQFLAITVAGNGAPDTIALSCPTGVVLDADNYLFIVDSGSHRIIGSGPTGFRCVIGCFGSGSASNQLNNPQSMSFDGYGNIFVTDLGNNRVQKFILATNSCSISYNQPKFSSCAAWYPNATTIASNNIVGSRPYGLFVNGINTVYMVSQNSSNILVWPQGTPNITRIITGNFNYSKSLFVSVIGDIYMDTGYNRVDMWIWKSTTNITVMNVNNSCYGLFIDINNTLYCTIRSFHQVVKLSLNDTSKVPKVVAGNGSSGSGSHMLNYPQGIFVDINFDLYVADCRNNRIQLFHSGQSNATTVASNGSLKGIVIDCPTAIILDADKNLFVVDNGNHRIIEITHNSSRCLVGCSGNGSSADQLNHPETLSFDSYGNMFVTDRDNDRVQMFILATNSCDEFTTLQTTLASTTTEMNLRTTPMEGTTDSSPLLSTDSTSISFTDSSTTTDVLSSIFVPPACPSQNTIGTHCNISSLPCDILEPCLNNGTCTNNNGVVNGYECACPRGFDGAQCQFDNRPCRPTTCWNNGTCNETSNTTFTCSCLSGWTGTHCQTMVNYCEGVKCENNGVCRPLFQNYTCECLGTSYSGRHCEIVSTTMVMHQTISKSFGYIAILSLVIVVSFFVIMDILKYVFGIDPTKGELEKIRRAKAMKRAKRRPVIQKFVYVSDPSEPPPTAKNKNENLNIEETAV